MKILFKITNVLMLEFVLLVYRTLFPAFNIELLGK